jgi:hypothetical protein
MDSDRRSSQRREGMIVVDPKQLDVDELREALLHLDDAQAELPKDEQDAYREAQQSVVDARRKAETHEGLLQVC